jgi:hypothetical protein
MTGLFFGKKERRRQRHDKYAVSVRRRFFSHHAAAVIPSIARNLMPFTVPAATVIPAAKNL